MVITSLVITFSKSEECLEAVDRFVLLYSLTISGQFFVNVACIVAPPMRAQALRLPTYIVLIVSHFSLIGNNTPKYVDDIMFVLCSNTWPVLIKMIEHCSILYLQDSCLSFIAPLETENLIQNTVCILKYSHEVQ